MKKHCLIRAIVIALILLTIACNVLSTSTVTSSGQQPGNQQPEQPTPSEENGPTPADQSSLFRLVKSVDVTPVGDLTGGMFIRIGYVPGRDRISVAFMAKLGQEKSDCKDIWAAAYREYTQDMQETDSYGIITCQTGPDMGGMFLGDDYYYAAMGHDNVKNVDGWWLAKYNAVTWKSSVDPFFYPLATEEGNADPMIAVVNGQIDVSSKYKLANEIGPGHTTQHQLFTPDLQFVSKQVLKDALHINMTSLLVVNGVINFITSTDLWGDMLVLQYDSNWKYLGTKVIKQHASTPEGAAFDGTRFYISYNDNSLETPFQTGGADNIRLAAYDSNWNLLDDIAVTNFVPGDYKAPSRPSLALHDNRIYVCYDEGEDVPPGSNQTPENINIQVHVKVYELTNSGQ